jgi:signal transduction histidine kinase
VIKELLQLLINFLICFLIFSFCACSLDKRNTGSKREINEIDSGHNTHQKKSVKNEETELISIYQNTLEKSDGDHKLKDLLRLVDKSLELGDDTIFLKANKSAMVLSKKLNDSSSLGEIYWNWAILFDKKSVLDSSYFYYSKANEIYTKLENDYYSAKMEYNMSFILFRLRNYAESEVLIIKALKKFEKLKKYLNIFNCNNRLLLIDKELGRYDDALDHYQKASYYLKLSKDDVVRNSGLMNNLSLVYQKQGKYEEAISVLDEALENKELESLNRNLYAKLLDNRAYNRFLKGDTTGIRQDYERAGQIREELDNDAGRAISHMHLAKLDLSRGDTLSARNHSKSAYELAVNKGFNRDVLESLQLLSKTDPDHSTEYMDEYIALNDKLVAEERNVRDKFARVQYETEGYIAENRNLQKKNVWIILISAIILSVGLFFFVIFRQRSRNKRLVLENEQQVANEEIYNLMLKQQNRMEQGRVQERVRISEELHDGVLARLFGIRMGMGFLKMSGDEKTLAKYDYYMEEIQGAEQEIRALSHALKDDELSAKKDFPLLMKELLIEQARLGGFNHKFVHDPDIAWNLIPDRIKINVYRIAQEALHNVIKYAACQSVEVSIRREDQQVQLQISDDGKGFVLKKRSRGIGLKNMQSRSRKIGAELNIRSQPNQGTTIEINIQTNRIYDDREI